MRNNDELHEPNTKITYDTQLEKGVKFEFGWFRKITVILGGIFTALIFLLTFLIKEKSQSSLVIFGAFQSNYHKDPYTSIRALPASSCTSSCFTIVINNHRIKIAYASYK